ncbi:hypothetical protein E2C01_028560 [Portunus trituberculatus]|uniref:Uncharacterized protein n=1 Tax=Portunus trituberculatus TaxID=210409 RepID=A0A5B7EQB7_PORTR|nr:hypothetical protein [Portunus trituberculatus]
MTDSVSNVTFQPQPLITENTVTARSAGVRAAARLVASNSVWYSTSQSAWETSGVREMEAIWQTTGAAQTLGSLSADSSVRTPTDYKLLAVYLVIIFDISTETIY